MGSQEHHEGPEGPSPYKFLAFITELYSEIGILPEIRFSLEPHPDQLVHKLTHFALIQSNFSKKSKILYRQEHHEGLISRDWLRNVSNWYGNAVISFETLPFGPIVLGSIADATQALN